MYTKTELLQSLRELGVPCDRPVIVHSSLKKVGAIEGGAETLLEVLIEHVTSGGGLLLVPTHTWQNLTEKKKYALDLSDPYTCIGTLPSLAAAHPNGVRSEHPTHSVVVFGNGAQEYVSCEKNAVTPASPRGCYGKISAMGGAVLLIGVTQNSNTFLHAVEEKLYGHKRYFSEPTKMLLRRKSGEIVTCRMKEFDDRKTGDVSRRFFKFQPYFESVGAIKKGVIGSADTMLCDAVKMEECVTALSLRADGLDMLADDTPLEEIFSFAERQKRLWELFSFVSSVPHGSGNVTLLAERCCRFAKEHSLEVLCDEHDNVLIRKKGSFGREEEEPVILQSHLDMVCRSQDGLTFDFKREPIRICRDKDTVFAEGTTLGADNALGTALSLAILENKQLSHPPLEILLTSDEETGMGGAKAFDKTLLRGRRMINLDGEEEDIVTVSCAGGADLTVTFGLCRTCFVGKGLRLVLSGLPGGHSGVDITKKIPNAIKLFAELLCRIGAKISYRLLLIEALGQRNAIPTSVYAELMIEKSEDERLLAQLIAQEEKALQKRFVDAKLELHRTDKTKADVFEKECQDRFLNALCDALNGVISMHPILEDLPEQSVNLGILECKEKTASLQFLVRAQSKKSLEDVKKRLLSYAEKNSAKAETGDEYPPWEYRAQSPTRELWCEIYQRRYGKPIRIEAIHAGLECGVFAEGITTLDCIAVGPNIFDVHTPRERFSLSSATRFLSLLEEFLSLC